MATIALYANKTNQMSGLISATKQTVTDFKAELTALKSKTLTINKSVCNLEDVISSVQASTQTQEKKIASLDALSKNVDTFIADVVRIDGEVADLINKRKDEFYDEYSYLKPECEKTWLDKVGDWFASAGEWCKDHWKVVVTVVIVIVAVALICTGVGGIFGAMALGALLGAGLGGVAGGVMSAINGGSFWEGAENGAFMGAISGIIAGGMGFAMAAGGTAAASLSFGQTVLIGGVSGAGSSLFGDLGDILIKGANISFEQVLTNMGVSAALGAAFAGLGFGLSKAFSSLKLKLFKPTYKYNMVENPGPLVDVDANVVGTFRSGMYNVNVLDDAKVLYRAGDSAGSPLGQFFTVEPPASVANVRIDSAVKPQWINPKTGALTGTSNINCVYAIEVPKGITTYTGPVGNQGGIYIGGNEQIFISKPWNIEGIKVISSNPLK